MTNFFMKYSSVFLYLALSLFFYSSQAQNEPPTYTCQIDNNCLNDLYDHLLNKESPHSVYQYCKNTLSKSRACCASPSRCEEDFGRENAQVLRENSSSSTQRNCPKGPESIVILQQAQNMICRSAIKNCEESCLEKLKELKKTFKQCFFIPHKDSIEKALDKAQKATDPICYQEMNKIAHQYKDQSLHQASLFTKDLKAEDIINCEEIEKEKNQKNLQAFFLNICQQVQPQQPQGIEKNKLRGQSVNHFKAQGAGLGSVHPSGVQSQNSSKNQALLGAGTVAGLGLLPSSVKKTEDKSLAQNLEGTEDKNLATDQALTDKAVSGDDKKPEKDNKSTAKSTKEEDDKLRTKKAEEDESRAKNTEDQEEGSSLAKDEKKATSKAQSKTSSQKRTSKNSSNSSKGTQTQADSAKQIKMAQARSQSNKCPIPMPRIQSAIVFQSVEAPQIEPMGQQEEQTNPDKPSFKSYDLANRKPAGVLIKLEKSNTLNKSFKIQLDMTYKNRKKHFSSCFHKPLEPHQKMIDTRQTECWLKESDFKGQTTHKFFGWHRKNSFLALSKRRDIHVSISLKSEDYPACQKTKSFKINIIKVQSVDIGWTGTSEKVCLRKEREAKKKNRVFKGYKFSAANRFKLVEDFIKSEEVSHYLEAMFPVYRVRSSFLKDESSRILVVGSCDNSLPWKDAEITKGILRDTLNLENWRQKEEYHKLVSVVPDNYFTFHGKYVKQTNVKMKRVDGLVIHPAWEERSFLWMKDIKYYGGSLNIAFVREDAFNKGVVAHEIGHTLGQLTEFYDKEKMCRRFNGSRYKLCHNRRIPLALDTKKENIREKGGSIKKTQTWSFIMNRFSIMDNRGDIFSRWIDRETHQKMFEKLSLTKGGVTPLKQSISKQKKNLTNLFISAYYHRKKDTLIVPEMEIRKSNIMINSFPKKKGQRIPFLTFQLREKGKVLKEKRHPVLKMEAEFFYKDGDIKAFPFPASPFLAQFSLPADYKKRDLRVYVFNPQGKRIYKAPVLKRKKEERVVFIDKAY